jgi:hypothetical protein
MGNPLSKKDSYFKKDISTQILKTTDFTIFLGKQSIQSLKLNKLFHNHRNRTELLKSVLMGNRKKKRNHYYP